MIQRLEVSYSASAEKDLADIFAYIVERGGSPNAALGFVLRIEDRCQKIGDAPRGGQSRDDLLPGLRVVPFERSAVIAYVIDEDGVRIINIFYGGRDFETLMRAE
ncbi:type II toxin-antitoxin system RelE/ParE family toxin [Mesorhizobium sp. PUT5]|uniref:type II toxin-antitoxin system RelE/ParE family toxin n=1 Tax=Mesorhizobium sp. PUT5 TaxID=3454629 RepID=UPI003FA4CF13